MAMLWLAVLAQSSLLGFALAIAVNTTATSSPSSTTSSPSNLGLNTAAGLCKGCDISIAETYLSYPASVYTVVASSVKTVIPYVTAYANGTKVTRYSTYAAFTANKTSQTFVDPTSTILTWSTLGTVLTYPTTYVAFPTASAGYSSAVTVDFLTFCTQPVYTAIAVPTADLPQLVFDFASSKAAIVAAKSYYAHAPAATQALGGGDPSQCSTNLQVTIGENTGKGGVVTIGSGGGDTSGDTGASSSSVAAVTHTSVAVLTTTWAPIVTTIAGDSGQTPLKSPSLDDFPDSGSGGQAEASPDGDILALGPTTNPSSGSNSANSGGQNANTSPATQKTTQPGAGSTPTTTDVASNAQASQNIVVGSPENSGSNSPVVGPANQGSSNPVPNTPASNSGSNSNTTPNSNTNNAGSVSGAIVAGLSGGNNGQSSPQQAVAAAQPAQSMVEVTLAPAQQPVTIGSNVVNVGRAPSSSGIVLGGLITIAPGQATVVNGVNVAVATNGADIIIGGSSTVDITASGYLSSTWAPVITVGTALITGNTAGAFVVDGQTLSQGATVTIGSDTIALAPTGGVAIVNGQTETISSATVPITVSASIGSAAFVVATPEATESSGSSGSKATTTGTSAKLTSAGSKVSTTVVGVFGSMIALGVGSLLVLL